VFIDISYFWMVRISQIKIKFSALFKFFMKLNKSFRHLKYTHLVCWLKINVQFLDFSISTYVMISAKPRVYLTFDRSVFCCHARNDGRRKEP